MSNNSELITNLSSISEVVQTEIIETEEIMQKTIKISEISLSNTEKMSDETKKIVNAIMDTVENNLQNITEVSQESDNMKELSNELQTQLSKFKTKL